MPLQRGPDTPTNAITVTATGALACSFYAIPLPSFGDESCKSPAKPGGASLASGDPASSIRCSGARHVRQRGCSRRPAPTLPLND